MIDPEKATILKKSLEEKDSLKVLLVCLDLLSDGIEDLYDILQDADNAIDELDYRKVSELITMAKELALDLSYGDFLPEEVQTYLDEVFEI